MEYNTRIFEIIKFTRIAIDARKNILLETHVSVYYIKNNIIIANQ